LLARTLEQGPGPRCQGQGPGQGLSYSPANSNLFVKHIKHTKQSHFVTSECPLLETTFYIKVHCTSERQAFLIVSHSCDHRGRISQQLQSCPTRLFCMIHKRRSIFHLMPGNFERQTDNTWRNYSTIDVLDIEAASSPWLFSRTPWYDECANIVFLILFPVLTMTSTLYYPYMTYHAMHTTTTYHWIDLPSYQCDCNKYVTRCYHAMADWRLNVRIPNCNAATRTFSKDFHARTRTRTWLSRTMTRT